MEALETSCLCPRFGKFVTLMLLAGIFSSVRPGDWETNAMASLTLGDVFSIEGSRDCFIGVLASFDSSSSMWPRIERGEGSLHSSLSSFHLLDSRI